MKALELLESWSYQCSRWIAFFGLASLLILAFAIVSDVVCRWFFNAPITGVRDAASLFVAMVIASSMPACIMEERHIAARFLGKIIGAYGNKTLEILGNLLTLCIFILMTWQLWLYANQAAIDKESTAVLGWPVSPWWRCISVIMAVCVAVQIVVLFKILFRTESSDEPSATEGGIRES
jgi:TRAP-type C4-dicarboxylate transport system permease small subunit